MDDEKNPFEGGEFVNSPDCEWILKDFVEMVRSGERVPDSFLNFIADGVERHLKYEQPWTRAKDQRKIDAMRVGLMLAIKERGGKQYEIAEYYGVSPARVSEMMKHSKKDEDMRYMGLRQGFKIWYLQQFESKSYLDMLEYLSEKKEVLERIK